MDLGGVAGGLKYHVQGIVFKFAMDIKLNEDIWMYGGEGPMDEVVEAVTYSMCILLTLPMLSLRVRRLQMN